MLINHLYKYIILFRKNICQFFKRLKDLDVLIQGAHCCYFKYKFEKDGETEEGATCLEITDAIYKNIKDYIKDIKDSVKEDGVKVKEYKIDCNSSFLTISLFSILLFLL